MGKKRLVIDLDENQHQGLSKDARAKGLTVSNYVRQAIGLPLERQGVKATGAQKKTSRRKAAE